MSILVCASSKSHLSHYGSFSTISLHKRVASFFSRISANKSSSKWPLKTNSRLGRVPACIIAILKRSCLVISNISSNVKSSVGFNFRLSLLQAIGAPSLPCGLNYYRLSLIQSKRTLLWMCWHSARKFLSTPSSLSSSSLTYSKSNLPSGCSVGSAFSLLSFLRFSNLK